MGTKTGAGEVIEIIIGLLNTRIIIAIITTIADKNSIAAFGLISHLPFYKKYWAI